MSETYDARSVAEALGLEPRGRKMRCPHPDHADSHPSTAIGQRGWRCYGCGASGDAITLVRLVLGLGYRDAVAWITGGSVAPTVSTPTERTIELSGDPAVLRLYRPVHSTAQLGAWLHSRGLTAAAAGRLGLTDRTADYAAIGRWCTEHVELATAAGLWSDRGLWWPLTRRTPGVICPTWTAPGVPAGPRWRLYRPTERVKTISCHGPRGTAGVLATLDGDVRRVVVAEGEPDTVALAALYPDDRVIGLCAVAVGWRRGWDCWIDGAREVVGAIHEGHDRVWAGLSEACDRVGARLVDRRVPESDDYADRARRTQEAV